MRLPGVGGGWRQDQTQPGCARESTSSLYQSHLWGVRGAAPQSHKGPSQAKAEGARAAARRGVRCRQQHSQPKPQEGGERFEQPPRERAPSCHPLLLIPSLVPHLTGTKACASPTPTPRAVSFPLAEAAADEQRCLTADGESDSQRVPLAHAGHVQAPKPENRGGCGHLQTLQGWGFLPSRGPTQEAPAKRGPSPWPEAGGQGAKREPFPVVFFLIWGEQELDHAIWPHRPRDFLCWGHSGPPPRF